MLVKTCRLCKSDQLRTVIDLGFHPLADTFLQKSQLHAKEVFYPLLIAQCQACGYLTGEYIVSAKERYQKNEYSYDSSNSPVAQNHFSAMANEIIKKTSLTHGDLAVDIGSNVGTLLGFLRTKSSCEIIGIEPSKNIAEVAKGNNVHTIEDFLNESTARQIAAKKKAKVITATNVFNHIEDVDGFIDNALLMLEHDGIIMIEVPYVVDLINKTAFDTIYLEHVSYFAIKPHYDYFKRKGLFISSIAKTEYMGGSIRLYLTRNSQREAQDLVASYVKKEEELRVYDLNTYASFMEKTQKFKQDLCGLLYGIKSRGNTIIGIGAATKGNTLLNYCKIDSTLLDYIAESSPFKVGKYTPGSHIKIIHEKDIGEDVQHALILPWNIGEFLKSKFSYLGAEFIIPHM